MGEMVPVSSNTFGCYSPKYEKLHDLKCVSVIPNIIATFSNKPKYFNGKNVLLGSQHTLQVI